MSSIVNKLCKQQLINPPSFLKDNTHYEVIMGSNAYGVSSDNSDLDIYGFCIPPKNMIFPHLSGEILGFGRQTQRFEQFQQHHVKDVSTKKEYDLTIYNIVKYFQLCMQNNPNMVDSLFVPRRCIIHSTQIGEHVRENRKLFLHRGCWQKFKGFSYAQIHKMKTKNPDKDSKRFEMIQKHGFDLKFGYHTIRLLNEVEQILTEHDLDLERNREQLKSIRNGDWTQEQIIKYFEEKEKSLEKLYTESTLQYSPDEDKIKKILIECLEMHYGNLDEIKTTNKDDINIMLDQINSLCEKIRKGI